MHSTIPSNWYDEYDEPGSRHAKAADSNANGNAKTVWLNRINSKR